MSEQRPTSSFDGYDIPTDLMLMTGGGPETFSAISAAHTESLQKWIGIEENHRIIEIGCGIGRDAIPLTRLIKSGSYVGIDIIGRSIEWCQNNISANHSNFSFLHFDVRDQLHNPNGSTLTKDITLPFEEGTIDRIFLFSVFTHMFREDIEHYLREFRRVLKPSGLIYATTFIFDEAILASARSTNLTPFDLRFEHIIDPDCRINDVDHPLGAIAFTKLAWDGMIERSGLKYVNILQGGWSGYYINPPEGQDVLILQPL